MFKGRPPSTDYFAFSIPHLADLLNLTFLIIPGVLVLLAIWYFHGKKDLDDAISRFLALLSIGSLSFLVFFCPGLTMARDWDLMSLSFLPSVLLVMYQIDRTQIRLAAKYLVAYALCVGFMTSCYLASAIAVKPAEDRFESLLSNSNDSSWVIFANYFLYNGGQARYKQIIEERSKKFPELKTIQMIYSDIKKGWYERALDSARTLVANDPYNPNYLQMMGNIFGKKGDYSSSEQYYKKAVELRPYSSIIMNELGQLYMKEGKYDRAVEILSKAHTLAPDSTFIIESLALSYIYKLQFEPALKWADTLFASDLNSPGGHLIELTVSLQKGDTQSAKYHYIEYLKFGKIRSDYEKVKKFYEYLIN